MYYDFDYLCIFVFVVVCADFKSMKCFFKALFNENIVFLIFSLDVTINFTRGHLSTIINTVHYKSNNKL